MNKHPYLRAYLAGIAVPTVFLLVVMTNYTVIRYVWDIPIPIERVIVFPMAAVPNAWGLWNVVYRAFFAGRRVSLGVFGGALPLLLVPCGYLVARLLGFTVPHVLIALAPFTIPVALIVYYLVWKYFVGFLNAELGIA
ncbi:MAG TPA: hypothetical protein VFB10_07155 [Candidatus Dormibacteraeota bacterium]|nr:hypothetical protein [Candidatus Dormibacteraeota bacterium]